MGTFRECPKKMAKADMGTHTSLKKMRMTKENLARSEQCDAFQEHPE
jgi:hypothetical protein